MLISLLINYSISNLLPFRFYYIWVRIKCMHYFATYSIVYDCVHINYLFVFWCFYPTHIHESRKNATFSSIRLFVRIGGMFAFIIPLSSWF